MGSALEKAIELILSGNAELADILLVTARMTLPSSLIALAIGVPLGVLLGSCVFPGRRFLTVLNRTMTGMPPVVCGLIFYLLFSGVGPFRSARILFTVRIMILAQIVLITPIVAGCMESFLADISPGILETGRGLGLGKRKLLGLLINESRYQIVSAYLLGFSRSIAEVGAVSMVGGAISWKTNVMSTAIMEYTNKGNFEMGIAIGVILMVISFIVNLAVSLLQERITR